MHNWICLGPLPYGLNGQAGKEFAPSLVEIFKRGAEQRLAKPTRAGEEEVLAGVQNIQNSFGLVDVEIVRSLLA